MKLTFQVMYSQFSLFLHVNYSILINIIKLLKSDPYSTGSKFCFLFGACKSRYGPR